MENNIPRNEYPRMQFRREYAWMNLNGRWDFAFDPGRSGEDRKIWEHPEMFDMSINVPFAPESALSGICRKDFVESVYYQREITIPEEWSGRRVILHFGAVDYTASVRIDGVVAGTHTGGSSSFSFDITDRVVPEKRHVLTVHAEDFLRSGDQGIGKQSPRYNSFGCSYTRTTGIWQTVWMEAVHKNGLKRCSIIPDVDESAVRFMPEFINPDTRASMHVIVSAQGEIVAEGTCSTSAKTCLTLHIENPRLWNPNDPFLYDVLMTVTDVNNVQIDRVESYFGMRKFHIEGNRFYLNNEPIFLRWVLDQGFYPDGIWTAPDDFSLKHDIELSLAAGFNGARLHQKIFEERFHYWADKLGYLTSAEYPSWGISCTSLRAYLNFSREWRDLVLRDMNHPSVVMWTPLNETCSSSKFDLGAAFGKRGSFDDYKDFIADLEFLTERLDGTRPFHDTSGYVHCSNPNIFSVHAYMADSKALLNFINPESGKFGRNVPDLEPEYNGQPYFVDEWGGFKYIPDTASHASEAWGYNGISPKSPEEFVGYIAEQTEAMKNCETVAGWCYTQLTDVEQEQNGVYMYNRTPKAPNDMLKKAIEQKPDWSKF